MSESKRLFAQIDATRGQDPLEDASLEGPRTQEFNELFCQIAFGEHKVQDLHGADTPICEHATGVLTTALWELSFGGHN